MASTYNVDSILPATPVNPVNGYVTIPAFEYSGIGWKGASEIITQFNYNASKNFILRQLPEKPVGVNFIPVIRYRIGMITYRYKLWDHEDGVLQENIYNGEVIKKNFVIEIWNISSSNTVILDEAITLMLSIKRILTDFSNLSNYQDASSSEVSQQSQISVSPTTPVLNGLLGWYATGSGYEGTITQSGGLISQWNDNSGNGYNLVQGVDLDKPQAVLDGGFTRLSFGTTRWIGRGGGFDAGTKVNGIYLVANYQFTPLNATVLDFGSQFGFIKNSGLGGALNIRKVNGVFVAFPSFSDSIKSQVYVRFKQSTEEFRCEADVNFLAPLIDGTFIDTNPPDDMSRIIVGDINSINSANMVVYELLVYNRGLTDTEHVQVLQYLANKYNPGGYTLPLQWNSNLPQTTN